VRRTYSIDVDLRFAGGGMKYALKLDERIEATPKASGVCPCCGTDVIAKCGNSKVWHWAHKGRRTCDHWWENETQWHRDWKNRFPKEWQEVIHHDLSGEKHIADVKTPDGLVLEFQHSAIKPEELASREAFYKNMIWVVDGQRLSREAQRLYELLSSNWALEMCVVFEGAHKRFPKSWLHSTVPVYFDIGHPDYLICLLHRAKTYFYYKFPRSYLTTCSKELINRYGTKFFTEYPKYIYTKQLEERLERIRESLNKYISIKRGKRVLTIIPLTRRLRQEELLYEEKLNRADDLTALFLKLS
jgi:competence protein CoiA